MEEDPPDYDPDSEGSGAEDKPAAAEPVAEKGVTGGPAAAKEAAAVGKTTGAATGGAQGAAAHVPAPIVEEGLPGENDRERWLELLRDGFVKQCRKDCEYPEPPPFPRASQLGIPPGCSCEEGYFPRLSLSWQMYTLKRLRSGADPEGCSEWGGGGASWKWSQDRWPERGGPYGGSAPARAGPRARGGRGLLPHWAQSADASNLPQLLGQLQAHGVSPQILHQVTQQAQAGQLSEILDQVAKTLVREETPLRLEGQPP